MHDTGVAGAYELGVPHLQLGELIGGGGFARVYLGYDSLLKRHLAVKILRPVGGVELRAVFEAEAAAHGALSRHPSIVTIHQVGWTVDGSRPFLVMDHVAGGSLGDHLAASGPVPWARAAGWMVPVCDAVQAAHDLGILHRDLKPDNILLEPSGAPLLSDFGIACLRDDTSPLPAMSVGHAAPEALRGERRDTASDVYSLASTLYHLVAGRLPFGPEAMSRLRQIDDPPPPLPAELVPAWLDGVIRRAMDPDPSRRFVSARELGWALQAGAGHQTISHPTVAVDPGLRGATARVATAPDPASALRVRGVGPTTATRSVVPTAAAAVAAPVVSSGRTAPPADPRRSGRAMMAMALVAAVLAVVATLAWVRYEQRGGEATGAADAGATGSIPASDPPVTDPAATDSVAGPTVTGTTITATVPTATSPKATGTVGEPAGPGTGSVAPTDPPPAAVEVPVVAAKTEADARAALAVVDLSVGSTTRATSCTVAKDRAIGTTPAAGAQAHEGDAVTLQLSNGAPTAKVPAVVGQSEKVASDALAGAGFTVTVKAVFLPKGDAKIGLVTAQSTAGGVTASTCSAVTLTVGRQQLVITNPSITLAPPTTVGKLAP